MADKFVDSYYVESDQQSALHFTTGIASLRLNDELKLTAGRRAAATPAGCRCGRCASITSARRWDCRRREAFADYELDIRPQGGGELSRTAHVELSQESDGTWRVSNFSDAQPR